MLAILSLGMGLCVQYANAASDMNMFVKVSSTTPGVERVVSVSNDFYVTTWGVKRGFCAEIAVEALSPWVLVNPISGSTTLGIGEMDLYRVRDDSGTEDKPKGQIRVLKLDIEQSEVNVCWSDTICALNLTNDSYPGGNAIWSSVPEGISGVGDSITFSPKELPPGRYTVSARSEKVPTYKDTCIVRIVKVEIISPQEEDVHLQGEEIKYSAKVIPPEFGEDKTISWRVLAGSCAPANGTGFAFRTTLNSKGLVKVKASLSGFRCETERVISVVRPEVVALSWVDDHLLQEGFSGSTVIEDPVWVKPLGASIERNEPGAYNRGASAKAELTIKAEYPLTHTTHVQVKGGGSPENFYPESAVFYRWNWSSRELVLSSSSLYESINSYNMLDVTWYYRVKSLSGNWNDWIEMTKSSHKLYTTLATPVNPEVHPHVGILDYACLWAEGAKTADSTSQKLLNNGFKNHYTWVYDCNRLSSDFIRLLASIGVQGRQHIWLSNSEKQPPYSQLGAMAYQRTRQITPVGGRASVLEWSWHQWAESASSQRDPSAAFSLQGFWGDYEDYLFSHYLEVKALPFESAWVTNNIGQTVGCEIYPKNCTYSEGPLYRWRGPDR